MSFERDTPRATHPSGFPQPARDVATRPDRLPGRARLLIVLLTVFVGIPLVLFVWIGGVFLAEVWGFRMSSTQVLAWILAAITGVVVWPLALRRLRRELWSRQHAGADPRPRGEGAGAAPRAWPGPAGSAPAPWPGPAGTAPAPTPGEAGTAPALTPGAAGPAPAPTPAPTPGEAGITPALTPGAAGPAPAPTPTEAIVRVVIVVLGAVGIVALSGPLDIVAAVASAGATVAIGPRENGLLLQLAATIVIFLLAAPALIVTQRALRRMPVDDPRRRGWEERQNWWFAAATAWVVSLLVGYLLSLAALITM